LLTYDDNGNLLTEPGRSYSWDAREHHGHRAAPSEGWHRQRGVVPVWLVATMIKLSEKWSKLSWMPETGMGYQIATVVLKDGRRLNQVVIIEGLIAGIRNVTDIPFQEDDIEDIIITHDKWDWSKEER
jgi:hypothetical protein